jgi:hypothetical protein
MPISPNDLVLVGILAHMRDLEIARVLGWYRIPLKHSPKTVAVDWLAFYQTAKFGAEKWAINYIAPVLGHELATRAELLRTEPNHTRAHEQYYKIQLGPLERLPRPIPARKWRRLTFLYTTGERLLAATEINDLIVKSGERDLLWRALRERGLSAERQYKTSEGAQLDLALLCALGNLGITLGETDGEHRTLKETSPWSYLSFTEIAIQAQLPSVVETIEAEVKRLGGLVA